MKGLAVFLVVALLIVGSLYAFGAFSEDSWWNRDKDGGTLRTEQKTVGRGQALSADVTIDQAVGSLDVRGGASSLMEAEFKYDRDSWKPIVDFVLSGTEGRLSVRQPKNSVTGVIGNVHNDWSIVFNQEIPMTMDVTVGAGDSNIDLSDLQVTTLAVQTGASDTEIKGSPSTMRSIDVKAGVGKVVLDLTGDWKQDVAVQVRGGVGSVELIVPRSVGTVLDVQRGLGGVTATGFEKSGNTYSNSSYGTTSTTIRIDVSVGVGSVSITQR
ncbi:MAG: toast rack family protein [Caldisericota bacterium]|nr:toast rack family protein [Caldisericota bacterium]